MKIRICTRRAACERMSNISPIPLVVGEHQRIVQDHGGGCSLVNQHFGEGEAHENRNLLLSTHAQMIETLLVSREVGTCR